MRKLLSQSPFGTIKLPDTMTSKYGDVESGAIGKFINLIFNFLIVVAGIYCIINLILAGYAFLNAGDDTQKIAGAWAKIWQTLLGLAVVLGSFSLAAIFGQLLLGDPTAFLKPAIPTP